MGRIEMVCDGCHDAWNEYDAYTTCDKCHGHFFDDCGCASSYLTTYVGVGYVCQDCDDYNSPRRPKKWELIKFLLEKCNMEHDVAVQEWSKGRPFQMLPCYRCKTTTCTKTTVNEIDLNQEECDELGYNIEDSQYGQCCKCFELAGAEEEYCDNCQKTKGAKPKSKRQRKK